METLVQSVITEAAEETETETVAQVCVDVAEKATLTDLLNSLEYALRGHEVPASEILGISCGVCQKPMWQIHLSGEAFMQLHPWQVTFKVVCGADPSTYYLRIAHALSDDVQAFTLQRLAPDIQD
jgi:hypothetical protein